MGIIIEEYKRYKKVTYYTVVIDDNSNSEFNRFIEKFYPQAHLNGNMQLLLQQLRLIGEVYGATERHFKAENHAKRFLVPHYYIDDKVAGNFGLRLYCHVINERIVIIYNGCLKTAQKAQDCKNCSGVFYSANTISRKINLALIDGTLQLNEMQTAFLDINDVYL